MPNKAAVASIVLIVLALVGWRYRDAPLMRHVTGRVPEPVVAMPIGEAAPAVAEAASVPVKPAVKPPKRIAGVRKCRVGESIVYVDHDCPRGSRELAADGGTYTVVPSQGDSSTAATDRPSGRPSTIRDDLLKPGDPSLRDKMIDRAVNGR